MILIILINGLMNQETNLNLFIEKVYFPTLRMHRVFHVQHAGIFLFIKELTIIVIIDNCLTS